MRTQVKVGLDQWLVGDGQQVDLITDGLNGCVAVGIVAGNKVSLAHVYSGCDKTNWNEYEKGLNEALGAHDPGALKGAKAYLVCAQDPDTKDPRSKDGTEPSKSAWLPQQLKNWLEEKEVETQFLRGSGCQISGHDGQLHCELKDERNRDMYTYGFSTTRENLVSEIRLPGYSGPPDIAATRPLSAQELEKAKQDGTDSLLTDEGHPAHGLYKELLNKMPHEAFGYDTAEEALESDWCKRTAAGLTVECLKNGVSKGIEGVSQGQNSYSENLYVQAGHPAARPVIMINFDDTMENPKLIENASRAAHEYLSVQSGLVATQSQQSAYLMK